MLKNYHPSERKADIYYFLEFTDEDGNGFSFPCDERGGVLEITDGAAENLKECRAHPEKFAHWNEVVGRKNRYIEPASGDCKCGEHVFLTNDYFGACQCPKCGKWYNLFGQELLPPEMWEENLEDE